MKIMLNVVLEELEDEINRQILVDENIQLVDLCEFVIVSMNGGKYLFMNSNAIKKYIIHMKLKKLKMKKVCWG